MPNGNPNVKFVRTGRRMAAQLARELLKQIANEIAAKSSGDPVLASA